MRMLKLIAIVPLLLASPAAAQNFKPGQGVSDSNPSPVNTVVRSTPVDRGAVVGTTAVIIMPANATRRGYVVQVQSTTASCYVNTIVDATTDFHSLQIAAGGYYETPPTHVPIGAVSVRCTEAAVAVYAREF